VTVQLILLFVAALTLFEVLSLGYRYLDRTKSLTSLEAIRLADRVAVIISLMEKMPQQDREKLTEHFDGSGLLISWSTDPTPTPELGENDEALLLRELMLNLLPHARGGDVIIGLGPPSDPRTGDLARLWRNAGSLPEPVSAIIDELVEEPLIYLSVRLRDGSWLNFVAGYVETLNLWPARSVALLVLLIIGIVTISIWAIQRLTAPFRVFATAAVRLGRDVNAPSITEHGPSEVRDAIRAFNEMQKRLQRFVEDRTQLLAAVSHDLRTPITRMPQGSGAERQDPGRPERDGGDD
jgi:hypothetical protein